MCAGVSSTLDAQCVLHYKILESRTMTPENDNSIYTQNMLIANANLTYFKPECDVLKHSQTNITLVIKGKNENVYKA
jgi:hypothetical protein